MPATETIFDAVEAFRTGRHSARELTEAALRRIEGHNPQLNAFVGYDRERALRHAEQIDAARGAGRPFGPLAGVPIAVKDNICTDFGTTTCGSRSLANFHSVYSATAVRRLEQAGAVVVGKTNLDEFAMGSSTESGAAGPCRNPWNPECVPGGSSGGSAAAVSARLVPAALGSDTGGSVRQPASYCGVVGLKPTYGRVSRYGLVAYGSSLDQIGTLTTDARDAALLLGVVAGHDPADSTSVDAPVPDYLAALDRPVRGLRVGLCEAHFAEGLDGEVAQAVRAAAELLEREGAQLVNIDLPDMKYAISAYYLIATAEASSNLARYDGVHFGHRTAEPRDYQEVYTRSRAEGFGDEVKRRIMLGTYALSSGYYDQYYLKALKVRTLIRQGFERAFQHVDVVLSPVAPAPAFRLGEKMDDPLAMYLTDVYTVSANLTGLCAMSIPCGFSAAGLPIGIQLSGPAFGEEVILAAAHQIQLRTDFHRRRPALAAE